MLKILSQYCLIKLKRTFKNQRGAMNVMNVCIIIAYEF